jgi:hypothetical protein
MLPTTASIEALARDFGLAPILRSRSFTAFEATSQHLVPDRTILRESIRRARNVERDSKKKPRMQSIPIELRDKIACVRLRRGARSRRGDDRLRALCASIHARGPHSGLAAARE